MTYDERIELEAKQDDQQIEYEKSYPEETTDES